VNLATLGMQVERTDVDAARQSLDKLTASAAQTEKAVHGLEAGWSQFTGVTKGTSVAATDTERALFRVSTVTRDVNRMATTTTGGFGRLEASMVRVGFAAAGVGGPMGSLGSALLRFGTGGPVTIAFTAGIAVIGFALNRLVADAHRLRDALADVAKKADALRLTGEGLAAATAIHETARINRLIAEQEARLAGQQRRVVVGGRMSPLEEALHRERVAKIEATIDNLVRQRGVFEEERDRAHLATLTKAQEFLAHQVVGARELAGLWANIAQAMEEAELRTLRTLLTPGLPTDPDNRGVRAIIRDFNQRPLPGWDPWARKQGELPPERQGFWQQNRPQLLGAGLNIASDIGGRIGGPFGGALSGAAGGLAFGGPVGAAIGGFTGLLSGLQGSAEAARRAAEQLRQLDAALEALRYEVSGDRLGAALAANADRFADLRAQVDGLLPSMGAWAEEVLRLNGIESERGKRLKDLADLEAQRAAQIAADHAREQERAREDLAVRLLRATGMQREADAMALAIQHQRELTDAVREHADEATIAAIKLTQAAEAIAAAAQMAVERAKGEEDLRYRIRRGVGLVAAERGDPGAAQVLRQAEDVRFLAAQEQELAAARARGADATELYLIETAQWVEAEARRLGLLRREREIQEDLNVRLLRARGSEVEADAMAFALAQQREYEEAVRSGTDATTLALLKEVQLWEARRRTADAIEEQIAALVGQAEDARRTAQMLRAVGAEAGVGISSPASRLTSTRSAFLDLVGTLRGGDLSSIGQLPEIARAFLEASRAYNASSIGFVQDTRFVQEITSEFADLFEGQASAAERQIGVLEDIRDILLERFPPTDQNPPGPPEDEAIYQMQRAGFLEVKAELVTLNDRVDRVVRALEGIAA